MDDFEFVGSYAEFIASEQRCGAAIRVLDATMEPLLYADDVVHVEQREAREDDVLCVQMAGTHLFGFLRDNILQRLNGPDMLLPPTVHVVGVVTAVIDRDLTGGAPRDARR